MLVRREAWIAVTVLACAPPDPDTSTPDDTSGTVDTVDTVVDTVVDEPEPPPSSRLTC